MGNGADGGWLPHRWWGWGTVGQGTSWWQLFKLTVRSGSCSSLPLQVPSINVRTPEVPRVQVLKGPMCSTLPLPQASLSPPSALVRAGTEPSSTVLPRSPLWRKKGNQLALALGAFLNLLWRLTEWFWHEKHFWLILQIDVLVCLPKSGERDEQSDRVFPLTL